MTRTKIIFHLGISISIASFSFAFAKEVTNDSKITVAARDANAPSEIGHGEICKGEVPPDVDLSKVSLTAELLRSGVPCESRDFDGNGYLDFFLYGNPDANHYRHSLVIFYGSGGVLRTQVIRGVPQVFDLSAKERKSYPKYKTRSGLIKFAEGDQGVVYFYDPKDGVFHEVPYVYPKGYLQSD